jgi:hypothetical protein
MGARGIRLLALQYYGCFVDDLYNEQRAHQGRWCFGKTPMQTFLDALPLAKEKLLPHAA